MLSICLQGLVWRSLLTLKGSSKCPLHHSGLSFSSSCCSILDWTVRLTFLCNSVCFSLFILFYTRPHLFQRVNGHKHSDVKKGRGKLECLIYEMLLIKEKRPNLNTQEDPIREKVFNKLTLFFTFL